MVRLWGGDIIAQEADRVTILSVILAHAMLKWQH